MSDCTHESFNTTARILRFTDNGDKSEIAIRFAAEIKINCAQCGQAFEFIGLSMGVSATGPTSSPDGTELRIPMRPAEAPIEKDPNKVYN